MTERKSREMIRVRPSFADRFACTASRCAHSCCIGWEIDIDPASRALYASVGGELGKELAEKISVGDEPHFLLGADERCPFLNEQNLCRLILSLGEDALCDVCAEHPRFYNCFPGREEMGLGLCCEEVVRLLVHGEDFMLLAEDDGGDESRDEWAESLAALRAELFAIVRRGEWSFLCRMDAALSRLGAELPAFRAPEWARFLLTLERMDERWTQELALLASAPESAELESALEAPRYERIFRYLLYRHLITAEDEADARRRLRFCALTVLLLCTLDLAEAGWEDEHLRLWSAEIEYSDENLRKICEML